jgi:hypothetical protein
VISAWRFALQRRELLILILDSVMVLGLISSISHYLWTANESIVSHCFRSTQQPP